MLKIWGRRNAFNVQKVMWLIGELNIPHEFIPTGGEFGGTGTAEFLAMNPHGKIPVIADENTIVWESHTILRYLASSYGKELFWSEEPKVRSQAERWMDWAQTTLQPDFLGGVFWGFYRTPDSKRNWPAINGSIRRCNRHFRLVDETLGNHNFLVGHKISLADITVGAFLYRYFELNIDRPRLPNVEAWYQRLQERPAYQEHVMVSFTELAETL